MRDDQALHHNSFLRFSMREKIRIVRQSEASECGLACLTMIANYYGNHSNIMHLRQCIPNSSQGSSLKTLMQDAQKIGLQSRAIKLSLKELNKLQLPAILHWNFNHFVVLTQCKRKYVLIADPASGINKLTYSQLSDSFTGVALELQASQNFTKQGRSPRLKIYDFMRNLSGIKRQFTLLICLSVALQAFAIVGPFYLQSVIDQVLIRSDQMLLQVLAIGFALLLLIELLTRFVREKVVLYFSHRLHMLMGASVFRHLITLPCAYFYNRHMGDIVSRFGSLQQVRELITTGFITVAIDGVMALVMLAVMFAYSPQLTLIVVLVVSLYAALRWITFKPIQALHQAGIMAAAEENSHFMQSIRAIRSIKLANKQEFRSQQWLNLLAQVLNKQILLSNWQIHFAIINRALFGIENILVIYFAAQLVMLNGLSVGMLFAFISYKTRFISALDSLINTWVEFKMLDVHLERIADIVHSEVEEENTDTTVLPVTTNAIHIELCKLSYAFVGQQTYLWQNLDCSIKHADKIAIIGKSGSGKSTLIDCMLGLICPSKGKVLINGVELNSYNRHQHGFAAVLQGDQLLSGTILENICDFDPQPKHAKAQQAAQLACIDADVMQMTMQYNTLIGDMGSTLSGGQKQRLMIARALYKQPKILFLDEATSHLDTKTEAKINQYLSTLRITQIIIAHRPQSILAADRIIELSPEGIRDVSASYRANNPSILLT